MLWHYHYPQMTRDTYICQPLTLRVWGQHIEKKGPREGDELGDIKNELPTNFKKGLTISTTGWRGSGDVITPTITDFRSRRGTNKIHNLPRKTLFRGKIRGSLTGWYFKENKEERKHTEKMNRECREIPGNVEGEKTEDGWKIAMEGRSWQRKQERICRENLEAEKSFKVKWENIYR